MAEFVKAIWWIPHLFEVEMEGLHSKHQ
ncbi:hypothetical protein Tco_1390957, partial [Tanacetum coccineum]